MSQYLIVCKYNKKKLNIYAYCRKNIYNVLSLSLEHSLSSISSVVEMFFLGFENFSLISFAYRKIMTIFVASYKG